MPPLAAILAVAAVGGLFGFAFAMGFGLGVWLARLVLARLGDPS